MERTLQLLGFPRIRSLLEYCASSDLGRSAVETIRSSEDPDELVGWLEEVSQARLLLESETPPPEGALPCMEVQLEALVPPGTVAEAGFCLDLAGFLKAANRLKKYLLARRDAHPLLSGPFKTLSVPVELAKQVDRLLDEHGEVRDSASPELKRLRRTGARARDDLRSRMEDQSRRLLDDGVLQENLVTIRGSRYVLPVKTGKQSQFQGLIHDRSASGSTLFMEPVEMVQANNELIRLSLEERAEVARIMRELTESIRLRVPEIRDVLSVVGRFEMVMAKARLSQMMDASAVKIVPGGEIDLIRVRHPLLGTKAVAQDISLGNRGHTLVITGQNAGGKTVVLKTVGLLALMLKYGLHLPCHPDSQMSIFPEIYVDIGDEQSIDRDLSTFSAHLANLKHILSRPGGPSSLVLMDELGDGTDPREGAALAVAVAKALHFKRTRVIITTHYPELKALATAIPGMINASMGVDESSLCPTFELMVGLPGKSYALSLARRIGLPPAVLDEADRVLPESGRLFEKVVVDLEKALQEVDDRRRLLEKRELLLVKREEDLEKREKGEAGVLLGEFIDFTRRKTKEIQGLVGSLKRASVSAGGSDRLSSQGQESRRIGASVLKTVSKSRGEAHKQAIKAGLPQATWEPAIGEWAEIPGRSIKGEIIQIGKDRLKLQVGQVTMWVNRVESRTTAAVKAPPQAPSRSGLGYSLKHEKSSLISLEINVVGQRVGPALERVEKYLDDALVAGLDTVRIIHGRGTFALRDALHEYLAGHSQVASFRREDPRLGGDGVTVVDLA